MIATLDLKLIEAADRYLDEDTQLADFRTMGEKLFTAFPANDGRVSTQVRNLQQIAVSVRRLSDVEDFVKNQVGKDSAAGAWRKVGKDIISDLTKLRAEANRIATDEGQRLLLRAYLARGWVKAVVGSYLYAKAYEEMFHA